MPGRVGDVAQRPRPGEHRQPVHRGPDRVLDAVAPLPAEHAGLDQLVECGAKLTQGRAILQRGPGFAQEVSGLLTQVKPTLPVLLANLTTLGQVLVTYNP